MPLGTIDRTPPPFFRQGPSALTKLVFCSALALFLMVADTRFKLAVPLRGAIATVLHPVQVALLVPVEMWHGGGDYLRGLKQALANEDKAQRALAAQAERAARADETTRENARLRALLELKPALSVKSIAAEVLYEAADPYSRKLIVDRGRTHGVVAGAPVVNDAGVIGQVTRVYPLSSEVTLIIDKDAAIPVLNPRTQQRSAAYGVGAGDAPLELRFMAANSDVQVGDLLTTSGVDGVYPAGLSVARVTKVERRADAGFARISLQPTAPVDGVRHVLLLEPLSAQLPPRPAPAAEDAASRPAPKAKGAPTKGAPA